MGKSVDGGRTKSITIHCGVYICGIGHIGVPQAVTMCSTPATVNHRLENLLLSFGHDIIFLRPCRRLWFPSYAISLAPRQALYATPATLRLNRRPQLLGNHALLVIEI